MDDRASIAERLSTLPAFQPAAPGGPDRWGAAEGDCERVAARLAALGARVRLSGDSDFPAGLRALPNPPPAVFVRGIVPDWTRAVAVVGSRAATPYGLAQARRLAVDLAGLGLAVVSGLARGIDAAAHRGALDAGGTTVAVLPGGLDDVSPRHHRALAEEIADRGGLVTEIASGAPVAGGMFVRRNRLIAALACATVVVEAAERSGALSTARAARRIDRPVLAVPGDVDRVTSRGCHELIRTGAALCAGVGDVLAVLQRSGETRPAPSPEHAEGAPPEVRVLSALTLEALTVERVAEAAELPIDQTLAALLRLDWAGLAVSRPGQRWVRAVKSAP